MGECSEVLDRKLDGNLEDREIHGESDMWSPIQTGIVKD